MSFNSASFLLRASGYLFTLLCLPILLFLDQATAIPTGQKRGRPADLDLNKIAPSINNDWTNNILSPSYHPNDEASSSLLSQFTRLDSPTSSGWTVDCRGDGTLYDIIYPFDHTTSHSYGTVGEYDDSLWSWQEDPTPGFKSPLQQQTNDNLSAKGGMQESAESSEPWSGCKDSTNDHNALQHLANLRLQGRPVQDTTVQMVQPATVQGAAMARPGRPHDKVHQQEEYEEGDRRLAEAKEAKKVSNKKYWKSIREVAETNKCTQREARRLLRIQKKVDLEVCLARWEKQNDTRRKITPATSPTFNIYSSSSKQGKLGSPNAWTAHPQIPDFKTYDPRTPEQYRALEHSYPTIELFNSGRNAGVRLPQHISLTPQQQTPLPCDLFGQPAASECPYRQPSPR